MSNIVLNTLTFVGEGLVNGLSSWWNRLAGLFNGFLKLENQINPTKNKVNVSWRLRYPVLVTESSACACPGELAFEPTYVNIHVSFDKHAPMAHRVAVAAMVKDLAACTQFQDSIETLTPQI